MRRAFKMHLDQHSFQIYPVCNGCGGRILNGHISQGPLKFHDARCQRWYCERLENAYREPSWQ